ncbi:ABC transporter permease [Paenibacillus allorhizosphaerae]|uniref:Glycine betaine/carnitine/choline transport system permease protein OpuCD n=1 Tax=Paenibacillus allorhizosphaerae TaxID=2849866 RepID=A0ABM8VSV9_9BACL|nr:ABC transporter permease [Paenibacillus allorhizosphaerae]CAG7657054.1 Glycine betaine/carnitine/choline transport system permease protein OpuCD [Paenibacillus allorhizosphaerae]
MDSTPNIGVQLYNYVTGHAGELLELTLQHIAMVLCGLGLALVVGIPLGMISAKHKKWSSFILSAANVIQVFPSLALLAILMIVFGLGFYTVVIGLFLYSLLPIIRNTYVGLTQVDRSVTDAGIGMGMSGAQLLWRVQMPLSIPFLLAGLRVAAVIAIGVATMAPLIGGDGLGREIYAGINLRNPVRIYAGAVPAAMLAIIADIALGRLQKKRNTVSGT